MRRALSQYHSAPRLRHLRAQQAIRSVFRQLLGLANGQPRV